MWRSEVNSLCLPQSLSTLFVQISQWPWSQFGEAPWPQSPRVPPVSASPELGLQTHSIMPVFGAGARSKLWLSCSWPTHSDDWAISLVHHCSVSREELWRSNQWASWWCWARQLTRFSAPWPANKKAQVRDGFVSSGKQKSWELSFYLVWVGPVRIFLARTIWDYLRQIDIVTLLQSYIGAKWLNLPHCVFN